MAVPSSKKANQKKTPSTGIVFVTAGFNNTLVTFTDIDGNTLFSGSGGKAGFKGSRKSTPYAATKAVEEVASKAYEAGLREVSVFIKGPGLGRIPSVKALKTAGIKVTALADVTPMPHNGCRPRKKRRT